MLSNDFQSTIPTTNIMYPVNVDTILPAAYDLLDKPKVIQIAPAEINMNKEMWINEWLNAS